MKKLFGSLGKLFSSASDDTPATAAPAPDAPEHTSQDRFQPLNMLEARLAYAMSDPQARRGFTEALLTESLYTPTPDAHDDNLADTDAQRSVRLLHVNTPDGGTAVPVFTARERIAEVYGTQYGYISLSGRDLLEMVAATGAWINPGLDASVHFSASAIADLLGVPKSRTISEDTTIQLGTPEREPTELIAALQDALSREPRISEAWLALAHWPTEDKYAWYVDIRSDLQPSDIQPLLGHLYPVIEETGLPMDVTYNSPDEDEGHGIRLIPRSVH
ncbi:MULTISPECIES: enhanced serine sensitivity protein SseB C-terminal domain-containing protein [unclassified Brevundimonas]|uniref:enhanced serine sensitivity protein SseB C-terminal domain-containing protein n=1 Tax=unclassified Brevundimonas TaxID=2622653 RepID=UPI0025BADF70|nr:MULTISPECIES: enhanced serine sensitivity protein SseB C-terminal domain-containing protein [unclassified Brevundimonas]